MVRISIRPSVTRSGMSSHTRVSALGQTRSLTLRYEPSITQLSPCVARSTCSQKSGVGVQFSPQNSASISINGSLRAALNFLGKCGFARTTVAGDNDPTHVILPCTQGSFPRTDFRADVRRCESFRASRRGVRDRFASDIRSRT